MEDLCRLCGSKDKTLGDIQKQEFDVFKVLKEHCNISLKKNKNNVDKVCQNCILFLTELINYVNIVKSVQKIFESEILKRSPIKSCSINLTRVDSSLSVDDSLKEEPESENELEISDFEDIESDGSNFVITKRKKRKCLKRKHEIENAEEVDLGESLRKVMKNFEDQEESNVKEEFDETDYIIEELQDDYVLSDVESIEEPTCKRSESVKTINKIENKSKKSATPPKPTSTVQNYFPNGWENPYELNFRDEINGKSGKRSIELDISDVMRLPDGTISEEGRQLFLTGWNDCIELKCHKCGEEVDTYLQLKKHFRVNHTLRLNECLELSCKICDNPKIMKDDVLISHITKDHYPELNYTCLECGQMYWNYVALYQHYKTQHENLLGLVNFCLICGLHMEYRKMITHSRAHENPGTGFDRIFADYLQKDPTEHENPLNIPDTEKCRDGSITEMYCDALELQKWSEVLMDCSLCPENSMTIFALKQHYDKVHMNSTCQRKKYHCKEANCVFSKNTTKITTVLGHHINTHDSHKSLCCFVCSKYFWNYVALHNHIRHYHPNIRVLMCLICGYIASDMTQLNRHLIKHDLIGVQKHICYVCAKVFPSESILNVHMAEVHAIGKNADVVYTCDICSSQFRSKYRFKYHMNTHVVDSIVYTCQVCKKQLRNKVAADAHYKSHFMEKRFGCSFCEKKFFFKGDMVKHERLHTGDFPYECSECGQRFPAWGNMQKHMKSRHNLDIASAKAKSYRLKKNVVQNEIIEVPIE